MRAARETSAGAFICRVECVLSYWRNAGSSKPIVCSVDGRDPGVGRLAAVTRAYITGTADDDDRAAIAELRRDDEADGGFSLYLRARDYCEAIITVTREGVLVLGLGIEDPDNSPRILAEARELLDRLRTEFAAPAGLAGVELAPAQSRQEWEGDGLVQVRVGTLPPE